MKKSTKNQSSNANGNFDKKFGLILKEIFRLEKKMDAGFNDLHTNFRQLQVSVDAYAHRADTYFQEMLMLARKVDRLEKWITQVAEKVGVHLKS